MAPRTDLKTKAFAEFRFYEELNDFLAPELRKTAFQVPIDRSRSVKDAIESVGVPHTEVDLVLVDGASVAFGHVLHGGERVAVYPVFERLDIAPVVHLRPSPLRETRFVLDAHLGKLARHLRLAGFDSLWENDYGDEEIVALSAAQKRVILTRDKGILKRSGVQRGAARGSEGIGARASSGNGVEAARCLHRMPGVRADILAGHALRALEARPAVGRGAGRDRVSLSYPSCTWGVDA